MRSANYIVHFLGEDISKIIECACDSYLALQNNIWVYSVLLLMPYVSTLWSKYNTLTFTIPDNLYEDCQFYINLILYFWH